MSPRPLHLLLLATPLLLPAPSAAFVLAAPARTWDCPPDYVVDDRAGGLPSVADGDGGVARVIAAITAASWNEVGAGTVIRAHRGPVRRFALGDGVPTLELADPLGACTGNCLAATFTGYHAPRDGGSWRITDADIVTNPSHPWTSEGEDPGGAGCAAEVYVEGVMVHEAGHGLGLAHSALHGATMYPAVTYCNNLPATLEEDDALGLQALYGVGFGPEFDTYTQHLAGAGVIQYQPCGRYYWSAAGRHRGRLRGPRGSDFDLYLLRWDGERWLPVASATTGSHDEDLDFAGDEGWYLWGVYSYGGAGTYHFHLDPP